MKNTKKTLQTVLLIEKYEKEIFDLKQLLEISKSLNTLLSFDTLMESILYICMSQMRVTSMGIFTKKNFDSALFQLNRNCNGFDLDHSCDYNIHEENPLIRFLAEQNKCITMCEVRAQFPGMEGLSALSSLSPSLIVPLKAKNHINGIIVLGESIHCMEVCDDFSEYDKGQMLNIASLVAIAINNATLLEMTTTDMMTHLKLKHFFYSVLIDTMDMAAKEKQDISILMLDIDFFKKVNDTYGHACGDAVLQQVAGIIADNVRSKDLAARYGGEEFVVLLNGVKADAALKIAERMRSTIETLDIEYETHHLTVTISIGISEYDPARDANAKALVERADQALYASKGNGRNRVTVSQ